MKLIDEEKVISASKLWYACMDDNDATKKDLEQGFENGVYFAETELKDLAVEFRKWPYYYNFSTVEENFDKFLKERAQK